MNIALSVINILIPLLPALTGDISSLIAWIASVRKIARESNVWTAQQEQAFRESLLDSGHAVEWLTD